eukprot:3938580-Rhodomonas_salina.1
MAFQYWIESKIILPEPFEDLDAFAFCHIILIDEDRLNCYVFDHVVFHFHAHRHVPFDTIHAWLILSRVWWHPDLRAARRENTYVDHISTPERAAITFELFPQALDTASCCWANFCSSSWSFARLGSFRFGLE